MYTSLELPLHPPNISTITPTYCNNLGSNYTFLIILMMSHDTNDAPTLEPTISYICRWLCGSIPTQIHTLGNLPCSVLRRLAWTFQDSWDFWWCTHDSSFASKLILLWGPTIYPNQIHAPSFSPLLVTLKVLTFHSNGQWGLPFSFFLPSWSRSLDPTF